MIKLPFETVIGTNYVRYTQLAPLIQTTYQGSTATMLNIFIDLYSIIKPLFGSKQNSGVEYEMSGDLELSSDIINMCAHYRQFFYKIGVNTRFFLIFGMNCPTENQIFFPTYNHDFILSYSSKTKMKELVDKNMKALSELCPYLPGIYYFDCMDKEVSGYIEYLLKYCQFNQKEQNPTTENMIITKDILPLQLIASGCTILRPQKYKGADISFMVSHNSFWNCFMDKVRSVKSVGPIQVNPIFFSNVLAMTRVPERNMNAIKTVPVGLQYISKAIELGYLQNDKEYSQDSINTVLGIMGVNGNYTNYTFRWKAISSRFASDFIIPNNPLLATVNMVDLNDPVGVKSIVQEYYQKCPIDLDRL